MQDQILDFTNYIPVCIINNLIQAYNLQKGGITMDMNNIVEQISFIKQKLSNLEEELKDITVKDADSNNLITAIVSGDGVVLDYKFNLIDMGGLNKDSLVKAVAEATNNALKAAKELEASRKKEIIGNVDIPNIPGLF